MISKFSKKFQNFHKIYKFQKKNLLLKYSLLYNKRVVIRVLHWKSISDLISAPVSARGLRTDTQSWRYQPYKLHHIIIKYIENIIWLFPYYIPYQPEKPISSREL
jgi:hypothetical protein